MELHYDLKKLYLDAFAPQPGEIITFVNDFPANAANATAEQVHRAEMTGLWRETMVELADSLGFSVKPVLTIDLRDPSPDGFDADGYVNGEPVELEEIMNGWGEKDIVIAITGPSITGMLMERLKRQPFRFASAPDVTVDFEGFRSDYSNIPLRFEILTQKMGVAESAEMFFRFGDMSWRCRFDLRGQRFLFNENGSARRPGEFINLPSGCANVQPYPGIDGDPRGASRSEGEIPAFIDDELVVYRIRENRIVEVLGENDAAAKERNHILGGNDPAMAVVTKLGLGVNDEARCNGTHVGDEKTYGMHWGYGPKKHFPDTIWAEHPVDMDMDFVYPGGTREAIFRNSLYSPDLGDLF